MFYSKMRSIENIKKLNCKYKMFDCYTFVNFYNTKSNIIRISENPIDNKSKLYGKLYYLDISLSELVFKLNTLNNIQINKRNKYYIETTNVYVNNNLINNVYIIL